LLALARPAPQILLSTDRWNTGFASPLSDMSDATDYLMVHARKTIMDARRLPPGPPKFWLRHIGSIYHLLAKHGAYTNIEFLEDYRAARKAEEDLRRVTRLVLV
jgi:hypothetical protein